MNQASLISQDIKINKIIESCITEDQYKSCMNLIRNCALPKQEKTIWAEMLKEKAKSQGIILEDLYAS